MIGLEIISALVLLVLGYLIGSIPVGYVVGRYIFKKDLFSHGSRSMGTTNAIRVLGPRAGFAVFAADLLKGAIPALTAGLVMPDHPEIQALVGLAAVVGHSWSLWVGLKGGKGVATSGGVFLAVAPLAVLGCSVVWLVVFLITRTSSLGSLSAVLAALPLLYVLPHREGPAVFWFTIVLITFIFWAHRSNIRRLLRGEEKSFENGSEDRI